MQKSGPPKRGRKMRREAMRIMLLAAAAGLSLAASTAAYADGGDGPAANSFFTELPGSLPRLTCRMFSLCPEPAASRRRTGRRPCLRQPQIRALGCSPRTETKEPIASLSPRRVKREKGRHLCRPFSFPCNLSPQLDPGATSVRGSFCAEAPSLPARRK